MPSIEFPGRGPVWLPEPFREFRPHQVEAVDEILDHFESGIDVVMLDAPTGAGKTIIGETTRILHKSSRAMYVCTTRGLQDQFLADFPHAKLIKGRSNYPTLDSPELFHMGIDCSVCTYGRTTMPMPICPGCERDVADLQYSESDGPYHSEATMGHCDFCHPYQHCPYRLAKDKALHAPLTVANTAYYLTEANNVGLFSGADNPDSFMIVDEADTLESVIMSFMELRIPDYLMRKLGMKPPERKTVAASWVPWAHNGVQILQAESNRMDNVVYRSSGDEKVRQIKERDRVNRALSSLVRFRVAISREPDNWVYDDRATSGVTFRPVEVKQFGHEVLFSHAKQALLMSATLISPASMLSFLGFKGTYATVTVDSNFDPERRPVWVTPAANMSHKTKDTDWPLMVDAVRAVLERHPDVRILVHTVSYEFTSYLYEALKGQFGSRLFTYRDSREREDTLERFRHSDNGVALAPSFDRGVDLPGDEARVIVVTKVPFPYLGDKQVARRLNGTGLPGKTWYAMETVRSLVQMTGRGMRHKDDWCISYILDRQFQSNVYARQRHLIPKWWLESLKFGPPTNGGREAIDRSPIPPRLEFT